MIAGVFRKLWKLHRLPWTVGRLDQLHLHMDHQADQLDTLKSSMEIPDELVEEFHRWKSSNPVPSHPLVSVAVATYNRPRLLTERCIPSILNQTYENLELIVVGDHCDDETGEAVAKIKDPRLTYTNLPQRTKYPEDPERRWMVAGTPAMNEALSMAKGDYITHLDDDDEYALERLEKLAAFAAEKQCDLIWHPYWREDDEGRWIPNHAPRFASSYVTTSSVFFRSWFKKIPWDINAHRLLEPGDWNRFRKIKYINPLMMRYPEPLTRHYREKNQAR